MKNLHGCYKANNLNYPQNSQSMKNLHGCYKAPCLYKEVYFWFKIKKWGEFIVQQERSFFANF